jgi:hypothetical protein
MLSSRVVVVSAVLLLVSWSFAAAQLTATARSTDRTADPSTTDASGTSSQLTKSEKDAQTALENAGYTQVRDVKSSAEGIAAKAMKDGREVSLIVDTAGKVKER